MDEARAVGGILVVEPALGNAGAGDALARLGPGLRIERTSDARQAERRACAADVEAVVVDVALGEAAGRLFEALRDGGPPALAAGRELDAERALAWFRRGAADCVSLAGAGDEALLVAVLEHARRWRAVRERIAAERRIEELERFHESVVQNMNSAVLVVDRAGRVRTCNAAAAEILGLEASALRGASARDWFPDAESRSLMAQSLDRGERFKGAASSFERSDGSVVPVGVSCAPIESDAGEIAGAVATFQDLSGMQLLQRQLLQQEKLASIGQLAAGVAHEINNPVGFIHANLFQMAEYVADLRRVFAEVEALQKALGRGSAEETRRASERLAASVDEVDLAFLLEDLGKAIRESQEGSERIRHIVQDLRDFSYKDTGERVLADVNQCLDSTASIVWPMMKHLVVLEKEYRDLPALLCYPMQLKQVFMNLLVNAYQAIEAKLGSSGETGRIVLRTQRRGDHVVVSVSDSGVGIAPEHLGRIFDPFFTTKQVGIGTGLGLSTSYSIIQRHGGSLEAESVPGQGASFRVTLPILEAEDD